jgi:hypothetical protein
MLFMMSVANKPVVLSVVMLSVFTLNALAPQTILLIEPICKLEKNKFYKVVSWQNHPIDFLNLGSVELAVRAVSTKSFEPLPGKQNFNIKKLSEALPGKQNFNIKDLSKALPGKQNFNIKNSLYHSLGNRTLTLKIFLKHSLENRTLT